MLKSMAGDHKEFNARMKVVCSAEGLDLKVNLTVRKAFGFRSFEIAKEALYHLIGGQPEPQLAHEFW